MECNSKTEIDQPSSPLVKLIESTYIIRTLVTQNKIGELLKDNYPEQLTLLLNNKSPAQMAFESEVLSSTIPLVVVYYFQKNKQSIKFIKELENLAIKYDDQIKFVIIDAELLFSLTEDAQIEELPTILLIKNRKIIDRFEGNVSRHFLEKNLMKYK